MKNLVLALVLVTALAAQEGPPAGRGAGRAAGGRGAPAVPAGPMPRLPDGHPNMQGFWTPPAITDIEPAAGRGGARGGGRAPAPAPPAPAGVAESGFGLGGGGNRIIDPPDGKIPYKPEARAKQQDILNNHMADEAELHCY